MKTDILIVGAGPAGIFTALELLRRGGKQKITIIEKGKAIEDMTIDDSRTNTVEKFMTNWLVTYKQPSKPFLISAARVQIRVLLIPLKARMYDIIFVPSWFCRQKKKSYEVILYSQILMNMV